MHRKSLNPAFLYRHIKNLYPHFHGRTVELIEKLSDIFRNPGQWAIRDVDHWATRARFDVIAT